jgi:hypothetical protein
MRACVREKVEGCVRLEEEDEKERQKVKALVVECDRF